MSYCALQRSQDTQAVWSTSWAGGPRINAGHMNGRTALHYAAHQGYEKVCNALLRRGASIGIEDHNRSTPIDLALRCGRRSASFMKSVSTELMQQIRRRPSLFASLSASGPPTNHVSPLSVRKALAGHWEGEYEYLHLKKPRRESWTVEFPGIADTTEIRDDTMPEKSIDRELAFQALGLTFGAISPSTASLTQQAVFGL